MSFQRAFVALGISAIVVYVTIPYGLTAIVLYMIISAAAPVAIVIGVRRHKPAKRTPWVLLAIGFAMYFVGDLIYTLYELSPTGELPYPNIGDIAYLAFYPVVFFALGGFVRAGAQRNRAAWLDALIWTVGAAILAWEPLLEPYVTDSDATAVAGLVALAYPILDIGLLLMLLRMFVGRNVRTPTYWLIIAACGFQTVSDVLYSLEVTTTSPSGAYLLDVGWLLTYVAIGGAVLHPSMVAMTDPNLEPVPLASRRRLVCLVIPVLLAPGLVMYQLITGQFGNEAADVVVIAAASTLLVLLVLARGAGLLVIAERRSDQLVDRQSQLEAALAQLNDALDDRERANAELNERVTRDGLTGLANRADFVTKLEISLRSGAKTSIAFLDLDDFKSVNDTLGHEAGDLLLVDLAARLTSTVGSTDLVARFGGDEFAVLITGDVESTAEQMLDALKQPIELLGRELRLQVSIGVTTAPADERTSSSDLLRQADIAMYTAKRAGGGWARYQTGMSAVLRERVDLRAGLVAGLRQGDVKPWFQPVVDLRTGELRGFEALARWTPDSSTVKFPGDWLPLAEETGLIVSVDRAVCHAAFEQLARWRTAHPAAANLHLAVNLSGRTLQHVGIAEELLIELSELGVPPSRIVVEVTEGVLLDDPHVSARLQVLRAAGVRVALDDFGTGWSSLSYLQNFPVDLLKLDQTFTSKLGPEPGANAIPAAVLQLARAMSLGVVAEGVETVDQRESLLDLGFQQAQGYLFAAARPAAEFQTLLHQHRPRLSAGDAPDLERTDHGTAVTTSPAGTASVALVTG